MKERKQPSQREILQETIDRAHRDIAWGHSIRSVRVAHEQLKKASEELKKLNEMDNK